MIGMRDIFRVGIGPSSSHTVGPMKAALAFATALQGRRFSEIACELLGSLAWTGSGHATDKAVILGLAGHAPENIRPEAIDAILTDVAERGRLTVANVEISFDPARHVIFNRETEPTAHPNTMRLVACNEAGEQIFEQRWCSIGGGFIVEEAQFGTAPAQAGMDVPFPFSTADELLLTCDRNGLSIGEVMRANEGSRSAETDTDAYLDKIIEIMMACIDRGIRAEGILPGRLKVPRRAKKIKDKLDGDRFRNRQAPHVIMDHVSLFAIAVNEENAAGSQVVTAPTNGAAGVIPAVLRYYRDFWPNADRDGMHDFLLTASAIGVLTKMNASISGAEVGCQGEVGTASAMAAAGLAAAMGGSIRQIENAAEIAMEHHLGMTCDPVGGLVQVPCIERNAFGAVKAINAASLAMRGDGTHTISLDQVIATMMQTGKDMNSKYKETSLGGLAVSMPEC
ncbi:L-serine ammonia-lyase [Sphingopyxis sp.]|uniref:L-serine ammonia-lyase n=1 Tax=Sphingopyxis sp. TaxID=1908224 RepID=UPI002D7910E9|nr:L-serine ammonia-lyase [Sphingopyxis sp.]HET6523104.1 L-serine ammonia-lyase [Sphingopyxis sp.]